MCVWVCLGALVVATLPNAVFKNVLTIRAIASIENWGGGTPVSAKGVSLLGSPGHTSQEKVGN